MSFRGSLVNVTISFKIHSADIVPKRFISSLCLYFVQIYVIVACIQRRVTAATTTKTTKLSDGATDDDRKSYARALADVVRLLGYDSTTSAVMALLLPGDDDRRRDVRRHDRWVHARISALRWVDARVTAWVSSAWVPCPRVPAARVDWVVGAAYLAIVGVRSVVDRHSSHVAASLHVT